MAIEDTLEKRFESDIEASLISNGGYIKGSKTYDPEFGVYPETFIDFIKGHSQKNGKGL